MGLGMVEGGGGGGGGHGVRGAVPETERRCVGAYALERRQVHCWVSWRCFTMKQRRAEAFWSGFLRSAVGAVVGRATGWLSPQVVGCVSKRAGWRSGERGD